VADPESWAAQSGDATDPDPAADSETIVRVTIPDEVPVPVRIEIDPDLPQLTVISAPDAVALPDLAETRITDTLVLALPVEPEQFPDRDDFIARFRALSNIVALQGEGVNLPQLATQARADEVLLDDVLRTYGYYDGEVIRQFSGGRREQPRVGSDASSDPRVRFDIIPGPRYVFGRIDLGPFDLIGDPELRKAFAIYPGDPLYADTIVAQRAKFDATLGESGYPFVTMAAPSLLIDHARYAGDLTMPVDPGGRYVFGEVVSDRPEFLSGKHLARIARFDPNDPYQRSLVTDLRSAVLATGLVSSVTIAPRAVTPPVGDQPGEVALDVALEPAPLRTIAGAIGYGTEEGVRIEARWEHRNLFPPEGALRLRGVLGTREQLGSVAFRRNNFLDRDQVLTIEAYGSDITTEAVDARSIGLRGTFEKVSNLLFQKPLSWATGVEILYTDERNRVIGGIPRERQTFTIGGVFGSVTWDSSDDLLDPTTGSRVTLFLAPEVSSSLSSEIVYARAQGDVSYYQPVGGVVLAGRLRLATIQGAQAFEIAPSRRLYAGGGGSVRGYGFQGIGPINDLGEPTGGTSLVEVAIEARIPTGLLDNSISIVPFLDAGAVGLDSVPDFRFVRYGAGVGVRYATSFGPIRVDVATPLNPGEFDSPIVVYVSLGQAF
jgi:translocation and assembly module TamA